MMYKGTLLTDTISIHEVFTIHYFEYMSDFSFAGESHNFWEFVFVDKGEIDIYMESIHARLKKGEVAFHKPNEFHRLQATGSSAPNLVVISFECSDAVMQFFEGKIFSLDETEKILLGEIVKEAKTLFNCRLDDPYLTEMTNASSLRLVQNNLSGFIWSIFCSICFVANRTVLLRLQK